MLLAAEHAGGGGGGGGGATTPALSSLAETSRLTIATRLALAGAQGIQPTDDRIASPPG